MGQVSSKVGLDSDVADIVYRYWILKRKAGGNKPLMVARTEEALLQLRTVARVNGENFQVGNTVRCRIG